MARTDRQKLYNIRCLLLKDTSSPISSSGNDCTFAKPYATKLARNFEVYTYLGLTLGGLDLALGTFQVLESRSTSKMNWLLPLSSYLSLRLSQISTTFTDELPDLFTIYYDPSQPPKLLSHQNLLASLVIKINALQRLSLLSNLLTTRKTLLVSSYHDQHDRRLQRTLERHERKR